MNPSQHDHEPRSGGNPKPAPLAENSAFRPHHWTWIYGAVVGSMFLRLSLLDFQSNDYRRSLGPWYDYFVMNGRWNALADDFSDYPPLFLYLLSLSTLLPVPKLYAIKLISIIFDYVAACFVFKILRCRFRAGPLPWAGACLMLFLPTTWFNSSVWGQCDVMYTAALLAAVYFIMTNRPVAAFVAFGFASSLKPQAIFLAPFLGGVILAYRIPWRYLAIPPLVYILCGMPAMLAGKPVFDVIFHWFLQKKHPGLTLGATNWYQWLPSHDYTFWYSGIVLACVGALFLVFAMRQPTSLDRTAWLVTTALASLLLVPYLLPGMHERYFFSADVLSIVYAFYMARGWIVAALIQFASFFTYLPYLFATEPIPRHLLALAMTAALALVVAEICKAIFGKGTEHLEAR